ncbi:CidA/LrgA family protein [uncultured Sphaerochaeta sp.]|uniref:CidA/LrgA family protein n=1 Tax=uncultured Sphaerochaeta sp. TaxID=886478 RepID=UPI002A0A21B8|nr:CidA/LrgA family protein [uncultured Sphaerochaeta sp.]
MKILMQIGILFGLCLLGEVLSSVIPLPLPGSIISMVLLFLLLMSGIMKEQHIEKPADYLLSNMTFFFLPSGVQIIEYFDLLKSVWWQLFVVALASLVVCFAVSSWTVVLVVHVQGYWRNRTHA